MNKRTKHLSESLLKYVSNMAELEEHYGVNSSEVMEGLQGQDSKISDQVEKMYGALRQDRICSECEENKFYDQSEDEYYCPVHD